MPPHRLSLLLAGLLVACLSTVVTGASAQPADERPNIVLIMVDDMGFSDIGSYGGEIDTPNLDRLAEEGLRFTQFYNTSKCFPTRASLMTGLYAHQVAMDERPGTIRNGVTIAEVLREAGYRTLMTGKWHGVENPFDRGFDRYFGLVDGAVNHFNPGLQRPGEPPPARKTPGHLRKWAIDGEVHVPYTPSDPDFYSTDVYTDYAIDFLETYADEERPYFLYLSYTAPHDPLQAWPEDIEKYRGSYMAGWDELRLRRYERQIEMGLIDAEWKLSDRGRIREHQRRTSRFTSRYWSDDGRILPWDEVERKEDWDLKMAVYAAMIDRVDQQIGRLMEAIQDMGDEDNTLVLFLSDNGGSGEMVHNQQNREHPPVDPPGPMSAWHSVDAPWANLSNTPFNYYKNWSHEGGIATPLIAYWPSRIAPGGITHDVSHIIDVMATAIDVGEAEYPATYRDERIHPLEGKSLLPVLEGRTRDGHEALFFEWDDGKAVRTDRWKLVDARGDGTDWQLYDMVADRTETNDLSDAHPKKVAEMAARYDAWADRVK
ncbi:MAG: arylsulfatase [Rhodothermales bacterium]